ncbi:MAG: hypothetical protein ABI165_12670 [Bryobacteraceae bacterium]
MLRLVISVLAGYAAIGALVVSTDQVFAALIPGFASAAMPPVYYFYVSLATDSLYSIVGGYCCAAIARRRAQQATVGLIVFGELAGLVATVMLWHTAPHWFGLGLLILYPPAVWLGGMLRPRARI